MRDTSSRGGDVRSTHGDFVARRMIAIIGKTEFNVILDSGADLNIISLDDIDKIVLGGENVVVEDCPHDLSGDEASGAQMRFVGRCKVAVMVRNRKENVGFHVVARKTEILLGRSALEALGYSWRRDDWESLKEQPRNAEENNENEFLETWSRFVVPVDDNRVSRISVPKSTDGVLSSSQRGVEEGIRWRNDTAESTVVEKVEVVGECEATTENTTLAKGDEPVSDHCVDGRRIGPSIVITCAEPHELADESNVIEATVLKGDEEGRTQFDREGIVRARDKEGLG